MRSDRVTLFFADKMASWTLVNISSRTRQIYGNMKWLQWRHMAIVASQITGNLSVCSTVCLGYVQRNIKAPRYWRVVRGIHQSPVDFLHKGSVTRKMFPCHDIIMFKSPSVESFRSLYNYILYNFRTMEYHILCNTLKKKKKTMNVFMRFLCCYSTSTLPWWRYSMETFFPYFWPVV